MTTSELGDRIGYAISGGLDATVNATTALMVIDVQYVDAHPEGRLGCKAAEAGDTETLVYYFSRLENTTLPAIRALQDACRVAGLPVIHTRIMNLAADSSDTSPRYKAFGLLVPPDSREAEILPEVAPEPGEIVLSKTTSGTFTSTNADFLLRNMGIDTVIAVGVVTNNCVETTVRHGADLGFSMIMVDEACAAVTQEGHDHALRHLNANYATVKSLEQTIAEILAVGGA